MEQLEQEVADETVPAAHDKSAYKRRLLAGTIGAAVYVATLGTAVVVNEVSSHDDTHTVYIDPAIYGPRAPRSDWGVCHAPALDPSLLPSDCVLLPPLHMQQAPDAFPEDLPLTKFPVEYQAAIRLAVKSPLGQDIAKHDHLQYNLADNHSLYENASTNPRTKVITFDFLNDGKPRIFNTMGAVRSTLYHENGHVIYGEWETKNDPATRRDMRHLGAIWHENVQNDLNSYGVEHARTLQQTRHKLEQCLTPQDVRKSALKDIPYVHRAVVDFFNSARKPHGLSKLLFTSDMGGQWEMSRPSDSFLSDAHATDFYELFSNDKCADVAYSLDNILPKYTKKAYGDLNESSVQYGLNHGGGGHGEDATTEQVASIFSDIEMNPNRLIKNIRHNKKRHPHDAEFVQIMARLLQRNNPSFYRDSNIKYVANQLG